MSTESPSLWELGNVLSEAFAAVDALLSENDGEYTSEMAALIDGAQEDFDDKALRTAFYADKRIPFEISAIEKEQRRLAARKKGLEARRTWLKEVYLPEALARQGRTEIHSPLATLRIGKGRARVVVEVKPAMLPAEFVRVKTEVEPDKKALLSALESGRAVAGVRLERKPVAKVS